MVDNVHGVVVQLHPVAAFSIVDSHERRPKESQSRVIGSLLGVVKEKGVYEIRSAYAVPHSETEDEVAIDIAYEQSMYLLHQAVNPAENVLGWFATSNCITMLSVYIHDYYSKREPPPVYITVDGKLKSGKLDIKAYTRCKVGVPDKTQGVIFSPVPIEFIFFDPERVVVQSLRSSITSEGGVVPVKSGLQTIETVLNEMESTLDRLLGYVKGVLDGTTNPNPNVGRALMDVVSTVPQVDSTKLEQIMNNTMQDLLMVVYLVNLAKTQLQLGETVAHLKSK